VTIVALWGLRIYLGLPTFHKLREANHLRLSLEPAALEVLESVDPISPSHSLEALLGTFALLLWTLLPRRATTPVHQSTVLDEYALESLVSAHRLLALRNRRNVTVLHPYAGRVIDLNPT
jgi:hypothetical protein